MTSTNTLDRARLGSAMMLSIRRGKLQKNHGHCGQTPPEDSADTKLNAYLKQQYRQLLGSYLRKGRNVCGTEQSHRMSKLSKQTIATLQATKNELLTLLQSALEPKMFGTQKHNALRHLMKQFEDFVTTYLALEDQYYETEELRLVYEQQLGDTQKALTHLQSYFRQRLQERDTRVANIVEHREIQLVQSTTRRNLMAHRNKELRAEIKLLMKDRHLFFHTVTDMKRKIVKLKKTINTVVRSANGFYDKFDASRKEEQGLLARDVKDCHKFANTLREDVLAIVRHQRLADFLSTKLRTRITSTQSNLSDRKTRIYLASTARIENEIDNYKRTFRVITQLLGTFDIGALIRAYMFEEERQKNAVAYLSRLNAEIESLKASVEFYWNGIQDAVKEIGNKDKEFMEKTIRLRTRSLGSATTLQLWKNKLKDHQASFSSTVNSIMETAKAAGCRTRSVKDMHSTIFDIEPMRVPIPATVNQFIRPLESRVHFLQHKKEKLDRFEAEAFSFTNMKVRLQLGEKRKVPKRGFLLPDVVLTTTGENEDEENSPVWSSRIFTYEELRDIFKKVLAKQKLYHELKLTDFEQQASASILSSLVSLSPSRNSVAADDSGSNTSIPPPPPRTKTAKSIAMTRTRMSIVTTRK